MTVNSCSPGFTPFASHQIAANRLTIAQEDWGLLFTVIPISKQQPFSRMNSAYLPLINKESET